MEFRLQSGPSINPNIFLAMSVTRKLNRRKPRTNKSRKRDYVRVQTQTLASADELHYHDVSLDGVYAGYTMTDSSGAAASNAYAVSLSDIAGGSTATTRVGNRLRINKITARIMAYNYSGAQPTPIKLHLAIIAEKTVVTGGVTASMVWSDVSGLRDLSNTIRS